MIFFWIALFSDGDSDGKHQLSRYKTKMYYKIKKYISNLKYNH